ncbi:hypothetical protein [Marinimicrobium sp. C2-29]|uniref:hypothetical protein n=1 Tax=Marinimicrobium sp. C2-29 TaxID=3139825 RepID=UPI003139E653
MNNINFVVSTLFCAFMVSACGSDSKKNTDTGTNDDEVICPDEVVFEDPLVRVISVTDSSSDDILVQVTLSELTLNQQSYDFDEMHSSSIESLDISSDGKSAICTIPCGLFSAEGEYSMVVNAPAFEPKRIEFEPDYESDGGPPCRNRFSGSYELSIALDPEH